MTDSLKDVPESRVLLVDLPLGVTKELHFTCNAAGLLKEAERAHRDGPDCAPGLVQGLQMIRVALYKIGVRAVELNDKVLLDELLRIGVVNPARSAKG